MSNPLIDKFYELHPDKKEEPKSQKIEMSGESSLTQEQIDNVGRYLTKASEYDKTDVSTPKGLKNALLTAVNAFTDARVPSGVSSGSYTSATNSTVSVQPSKLTSYDPHSVEDIFFETAEKIKNKDAKVISVTYTHDRVGLFSAGMLTMTFQVQVWDTP